MKTMKPRQPKKSPARQKTYFFSDAHLGIGSEEEDRRKELRLIRFLNFIQKDASQIFIVGDLFDYWFEYKTVSRSQKIFPPLYEACRTDRTEHPPGLHRWKP